MVPPRSLCILRLSALGDVTHVVPVVRRLQEAWPETRLTWIIGEVEHRLVGGIAGVEFIPFAKKGGWQALRDLRRTLAGRRFDVLLHLQLSLRANLLSCLVRADVRVGYDRKRSKELHGLFINRRIPYQYHQHVLDAFRSFLPVIGLDPGETVRWDLPITDEAHAFAAHHLPGDQPTLLISPCSSHPRRNWHAAGYAAVADHAVRQHGYRVVLCGGRSELERHMGEEINRAMQSPALNLIGRDTFDRLLAVMRRATVVLTPDSGPMHLANAAGRPVIGLHAATPAWRSGPYSDISLCVDHYEEASRRFFGRAAHTLRWGRRVHAAGVMRLIKVPEVIAAFDRHVRQLGALVLGAIVGVGLLFHVA
jgi:heptosyltransferase I